MTKKTYWPCLILICSAFSSAGCNSNEENTIPVDSYEGTGCLNELGASLSESVPRSLIEEGYGDLECVMWEVSGDELYLLILGYKFDYCGSIGEPTLVVNDTNDVTVRIDLEFFHDCICCHGMSLSFSEFDPESELVLSLTTEVEGYDSVYNYWATTLDLVNQPTGTQCRYPDSGYPNCGMGMGLHTSCGYYYAQGSCPGDLECVSPLADRAEICMQSCDEDADCPLDFLYCGTDGLCRFDELL